MCVCISVIQAALAYHKNKTTNPVYELCWNLCILFLRDNKLASLWIKCYLSLTHVEIVIYQYFADDDDDDDDFQEFDQYYKRLVVSKLDYLGWVEG